MYKLYTVSAIKKIKIILVELDLQKKNCCSINCQKRV